MKFGKIRIVSIVVSAMMLLSSFPIPLANANGDTWVTKASMPTGREGAAAAVIGDIIYVVKGYNYSIGVTGINEAYNTLTDTWTTLESAPSPFVGAEGSAASAIGMEGRFNVYVFGGRAINTTYAYNPNNDTWWEVASMPTARAGTAAVNLNNNIYVIGGRLGNSPGLGEVLTTVEMYSPRTDIWSTVAKMPTARSDLAAVVLDEIIYTFGGWTDMPYSHPLDVVEAYNPNNDTWWSLPAMPTPRNHLLAGICGSNIHLITGANGTGTPMNWRSLPTHEVYTPGNYSWWPGGAAPIPHSRWEAVAGTANNSIYVIGGVGYGGFVENITSLNEQYICPLMEQLPNAEFTWSPTIPDEGETVHFKDLSSDPDGAIVSWDWDFGDGTPQSNLKNPTHQYGDNGNFTVTLSVTDDDGSSDSVQHNIVIRNVPPIIEPLPDVTINESGSITFTGHVTDPGSDDLNLTWSWEYAGICDKSTLSLNRPPDQDQYPSPDINPRNVTDWVYCTYGDNGNYSATLTVIDDDGGSTTVTSNITVLNINPEITSIDYEIYMNAPRTQGYWNHQCTVTEPYGDHTGILQVWIDAVAVRSQVFSGISSKDDVCTILDPEDRSNMLLKAKQQLMALWLNVVSDKLYTNSTLELPSLTSSTTVGEAMDEIESVISTSSDKSELERVKDVADSINNFLGIHAGMVDLVATGTDLGSDDLTFEWDFGDGTTLSTTYCNDQGNYPPPNIGNPDPSPSPDGTYPFSTHDFITHAYASLGVFTVTLMVMDDDGGSIKEVVTITIQ